MVLSEGQIKILKIVAEKSGRNPDVSVFDSAVIQQSGLPSEEVNAYLGQLQGLTLVKLGIKVSGSDVRLINITKEGLDATSQNQGLR
ncbi:MAG: hypothetical protein M3044_10175 [Thermoproteota archaeon]|nr:hypothetical protein [Thermoproteota archaeon]